MERKTMPRIVALLLAVLLTCTSVFSVPIDTQAATSTTKITLSAKKRTLCVGKSFKLTVKSVSPSGASKAVTYKSSNKKVATVNAKGKVTGKSVGTAKITVTSKSNKKVKAQCTVTVKQGVEKIQTASSILMQKGKKVILRYDIYPNKGVNKKVTFKSSKPKVVSVSKQGKLTAKKVGKAVITVRSTDGGAQRKVKITVKKPKQVKLVTKVTLDKTELSLLRGASQTLHTTITPSNASKKKVYFVSSDTSIARVNDAGRVVAKGDGVVKIYAYASDNMANRAVCTVTVTSPEPDQPVVPDNVVKVTGVTLDKTQLVMTAGGDTEQLKATVAPANATNPAVLWESSDITTATVENGLVTPLRAGKTTISVTTADGGYKASCEVTVNARYVPVENVILAPSMALEVGETTDPIMMAVIPTNATNQAVTWSSSDSKVVTVSEYGEVTAVAKGTATVTVKTADGDKTASCVVTVGERATIRVESISVNRRTAELVVGGEPLQLSAAVSPDNATDKTVVWASRNGEVASVSQYGGLVTPLRAGRAIIVAQSNNGQQDYCEVTVRQPLSSVSLDKTELALKEGGQANLTVTLNPADATVEKVEWSSDNDAVEVSSEGVILADGTGRAAVRAIREGSAKITVKVTTKDGVYSATCNVTSEKVEIDVTDITLAPSKVTMPVDSTQELMAVLTPSNATVKPAITWSSSAPQIASVDGRGVITAVAEGTATITAKISDELYATADVTVVSNDNYKAVDRIVLAPVSVTPMNVGETASFTATVTPPDATENTVEWRSTDTNIISVASTGNTAVVTAAGEGTATLIATAGGKVATCDVTVYRALSSVSLAGDTTLEIGDHGNVTATLNPRNATCKEVKWNYSKPNVVSVISDGTVSDGVINGAVHASGEGTTEISVTVVTGDGREVTSQPITVTVTKPFKPLNGISFIRKELSMVAGGYDTDTLTVIFDPSDASDASDENIEWKSSDDAVASVDQTGKVTSGEPGTATITATVKNNPQLTATLTVNVRPGDGRVQNIELNPSELGFETVNDEPKVITPVFTPDTNIDQTVFWISLDEKIATVMDVNGNGVVTPRGVGTTSIIAVAKDGGKYAFCNVTVSPQKVPVETVTVESSDGQTGQVELKEGEIKTFISIVKPDEATYKEVNWESSNTDVATVDSNGVVTARAAGDAVITATATKDGNGKSGTIAVKVYIPATKVTITPPADNELKVGGKITLTAGVEPDNATYKELTWTSLNPEYATVDPKTGEVTGVAKGEATIRATEEHDGEFDEYKVKVYVPVTDITITSEGGISNLMVDDTLQLTEEITPDKADYKDVTWSSSDESVAAVDPKTGLVTGVSKGTATITAKAEHDNVSASFDVHVFVPATKVVLDQSEIRVKLNSEETIKLTAAIEPGDALENPDLKLVWESDLSRVVAVVPSEDGMSATLMLVSDNFDEDECEVTITAKVSDDVYATCKVTVVRREKAFEIERDSFGDATLYLFNFDRTADEYEVIRGEEGGKVSIPAEFVEHDYEWLLSKFKAGVYDNNFLKNYWEKFNWKTLVQETKVLNEILTSNLIYNHEKIDVVVTSPTEIVVTIEKNGKTKKITVTRVDFADGSGSKLLVKDGSRTIEITNINISEENGVVDVSATVKGMDLKVKISENSFTLYRKMNGRDRVVIQAERTEEQYTCSINALYFDEMMDMLTETAYDPSRMDAYNVYNKPE